MGKKKPAFFYFMIEAQNRDKQKGINHDISYYQTSCSEAWSNLDDAGKKKYKDMSVRSAGAPIATGFTFTPSQSGNSNRSKRNIAEMNEEPVKTPAELRMEITREMFEGCPKDDEMLLATPVFTISSNIFCKTSSGIYYPMEIGIAKYSLKEGVIDKFHAYIDPGNIESGYASEGRTHTEGTHRLPIWPVIAGSIGSGPDRKGDLFKLFENIINFIAEGKWEIRGVEKYIVYAQQVMIPQMEGVFKFLAKETGDPRCVEIVEKFLFIGDAADLLMMLMEIGRKSTPKVICSDMLNKSNYDYTDGKDCTFHHNNDNMYCAQGGAVKLCWLLSDHLLPVYQDVVTQTDKHLPNVEITSTTTTIEWGPPARSGRGPGSVFSQRTSLNGSVEYNPAVNRHHGSRAGRGRPPYEPSYASSEVSDLPGTSDAPSDPRRRPGLGRAIAPAYQ